jgi:dipeptidyl aminopeptidase/acylaminoacyl peptidase
MSWWLSVARWTVLLVTLAPVGPSAAEAQLAQSATGEILSREAFRFPFAARGEWLQFVRGTENGAAAAEHYARAFSEADYARYRDGALTTTTRISYRSGNLAIRGFIVEPKAPGPHPVIIFNHGGVMQWGRIILPEIMEFNRLAERGYIVLASAYRGEGGSEGSPAMDGGDVDDSLALIEVAERLPKADLTRIGMWGFSRGGLVTYGALTRTDRIAAAVIIGGPTDLVNSPRRAEFDEFVYPHVIRDYARDKDAALARLSPVRWPERLEAATPILLLHGGDDPRVTPDEVLRMGQALQRRQHSYRLKLYEGGSHTLVENLPDVRMEMDRWLDQYVRNRRSPPRNGVTRLKVDLD